jgi:hypothetical protein
VCGTCNKNIFSSDLEEGIDSLVNECQAILYVATLHYSNVEKKTYDFKGRSEDPVICDISLCHV